MLLAKYKLNSIEILISKALINSVISQTKFVLINNVLKKYNEIKNAKFASTKNERIMVLSKCEVCDIKKSKFMKHQEASRSSFVLILLNKLKSDSHLSKTFVLFALLKALQKWWKKLILS